MKNTGLFYSVFQVLKVPRLQDIVTKSFIFSCFTSVFTSADIIFYNFSELDAKYLKKDFCHKFYPNRLKHRGNLFRKEIYLGNILTYS